MRPYWLNRRPMCHTVTGQVGVPGGPMSILFWVSLAVPLQDCSSLSAGYTLLPQFLYGPCTFRSTVPGWLFIILVPLWLCLLLSVSDFFCLQFHSVESHFALNSEFYFRGSQFHHWVILPISWTIPHVRSWTVYQPASRQWNHGDPDIFFNFILSLPLSV